MDESANQEILQQLFRDYTILQIIVFGINSWLWYRYIKATHTIWNVLSLIISMCYLAYSGTIIYSILIVKDLRLGGVAFAFEMYNLLAGGAFVILTALLVVIIRLTTR